MTTYLTTIYDEATRPKTDYPRALARYLFDRFNMKAGARFLDLGCGRGDFLNAFRQLGLHTYGIDREIVRSEMLEGSEVSAAELAGKLPYADNSFDIVFSKSVIEHLSDPEQFAREQRRILRRGGRIIVLTPDWVSQMKIFYDDHTHRQPFTAVGLRDLLRIAGFQEVQAEIFYQYPLYWKFPSLVIFAKILQLAGPVKKLHKSKFVRWSRELMVLGTGTK